MKKPETPHPHTTWIHNGRVKIRQIQLLVELGRHETLQDAADALGISQPAASKHLSDLESLMGLRLFEKEGRRLVCNAYGAIMMRRAAAIMAEFEGASEEYSALMNGRAGRVSIGAIDAAKVSILAGATADLQEHYPMIELNVLSGSSGTLFERLKNGEIDIMLGRPPRNADRGLYTYHDIAREGLAFVARPDHLLATAAAIPVGELTFFPWVLQRDGSSLRDGVEQLLREHGHPMPDRILNTDSTLMTLAYLVRSQAIAVMSLPVAELHAQSGQITILDTARTVTISSYGILTPSTQARPPAVETVLGLLHKHADA